MTTSNRTWRAHPKGPLLTEETVISPWTGRPAEAVINTETGEAIAIGGATCVPFQAILPNGAAGEVFKGALREAPANELFYGDGPRPEMGLITLLTEAEKAQLAEDVMDGEIETGVAAIINPNPTGCNVCGEPLHMGCCNPGRPEVVTFTPSVGCNAVTAPYALTDAHVRELERAIRAEGYIILIDPDCNITLERAAGDSVWPICEGGCGRCERCLSGRAK